MNGADDLCTVRTGVTKTSEHASTAKRMSFVTTLDNATKNRNVSNRNDSTGTDACLEATLGEKCLVVVVDDDNDSGNKRIAFVTTQAR